MKPRKPIDIARVFDDGRRIDAAFQRAISAARQRHKLAGRSVPEWHDGKVVWIPADQIEDAKPVRKSSDKRRANGGVATHRESQKSAKRSRRA